jgi:hypothetical protein
MTKNEALPLGIVTDARWHGKDTAEEVTVKTSFWKRAIADG